MLGWVAAVMAIVSPSQPRPAVSQRTSITSMACACSVFDRYRPAGIGHGRTGETLWITILAAKPEIGIAQTGVPSLACYSMNLTLNSEYCDSSGICDARFCMMPAQAGRHDGAVGGRAIQGIGSSSNPGHNHNPGL